MNSQPSGPGHVRTGGIRWLPGGAQLEAFGVQAPEGTGGGPDGTGRDEKFLEGTGRQNFVMGRDGTKYSFHSSEATNVTLRPQLIVTYKCRVTGSLPVITFSVNADQINSPVPGDCIG